VEVVPIFSKTLAGIYEQQGHLNRAKFVYSKLLEKKPADPEVRKKLAEIHELETRHKAGWQKNASGPLVSDGEIVDYLMELLERVRRGRRNGLQ